jgi:hypothetical protein
MATFKAVVEKHHKKTDGTYNVKIRVTHKRVVKYMATQVFVTKDEVTKSMKIKNRAVPDVLEETVRKYRNACNALGDKLETMTADRIVEHLRKSDDERVFRMDFIKFGEETIALLEKNGRKGTAGCYGIALNALKRFTGRESLDISEITVTFLDGFVDWVNGRPPLRNREKGGRAQSLYTSNIRTLHNLAKRKYNRESEGVILIPQSPFTEFKIPRLPPTRKRALPVGTVQAIAALPYGPDTGRGENRYNLAKDVFLLSFGLVGMNTVDLYNCDCMEEGRITYRRTKVSSRRADGAEISIRIEPEILPLSSLDRDALDLFRLLRLTAMLGYSNLPVGLFV